MKVSSSRENVRSSISNSRIIHPFINNFSSLNPNILPALVKKKEGEKGRSPSCAKKGVNQVKMKENGGKMKCLEVIWR